MSEADTFTALKFGIFTAEDIKHRWITNDNSKFVSLPNEVKVRWLELLRDRYLPEVSLDRQCEFLEEINSCIERPRNGDYSNRPSISMFFSFGSGVDTLLYSFLSFSTFPSPFFSSFFTAKIMNDLKIDAKLLNDAIKEYMNIIFNNLPKEKYVQE